MAWAPTLYVFLLQSTVAHNRPASVVTESQNLSLSTYRYDWHTAVNLL